MKHKVKRSLNSKDIFYTYLLKNLYIFKYILIIEILLFSIIFITITSITLVLHQEALGIAILLMLVLFWPFLIGISLFVHLTWGPIYWFNRRRIWHITKGDYVINIHKDHIEIVYDWEKKFYKIWKIHHRYNNIINFKDIQLINNCRDVIDNELFFKLKFFNKKTKYGRVFLPGKQIDDIYQIKLSKKIPFYNFSIQYSYNKPLTKEYYDLLYIELDDLGKNIINKSIFK